jgi:RHS repeat-associated protein
MPTDYGFTGQRNDATTGLQYYGSRFYDPSAGQFASADTVLPGAGYDPLGLSRYAYVEGNPVTRTDPSGHYMDDGSGGRAFLNPNTGVTTYYTNAPPSRQYPKTVYRIPASPGFRPPPRPVRAPTPAPRPAPHQSPSNTSASGPARAYRLLDSTVGQLFGHQDYYSFTFGGTCPQCLPIAPTFGFTLTGDKLYFTEGVGFATPGPSAAFAGGTLLHRRPSQAQVDGYVSGASLSVSGAKPAGAGGVWGNEGQLNANAVGGEGLIGVEQAGVYQTVSFDTSDPQFWNWATGWPIDARSQ